LKNINNIIKSYEISSDKYRSNYKSKHWERYNLRKKLYIKSNLFNFRNNKLSDGLDDQNSLKRLKKITEKYFLKEKRNKIPFYKNIYYLIKRKIYLVYEYLRN
jgi:hypothetical protein